MYLCGFGVQRDKLKCIISESALNRLLPSQSALRDILHESIQVLGVAFKYIGDILRLQCRNQERLQRVHEFVISDKALNASKKDIYSVCGLLGFDPARLHPEARAVADALRALIGKRFSRDDWNCPLDFVSEFSAKQFQTYIALLSWARELASQPDCVHDSPCISQGIEYSLVLASDASRSGGGFVISKSARGGGPNNEAVPLCSDAFRWSASQRLYHSNRRELMALLAGLRVLANVLEHLFAHHRGGSDSCRLPTGVVILSDNRACVAWAAEDAVSLFGQKKAIEKRALGRLVLALAEELKLIRRRVPVNVSHIKGSLNAEADRLSRLFDRTLRGGISIGDSLVGQENPDAPSWPTDDDHDDLMYLEVDDPEFNHYDEVTGDDLTPYDIIDRVRLFASCTIENSSLNVRADVISVIDPPGTSPLIDHISRDSYDSVSVYNTVKAMRFIFRLLHTHSRGDGALQQLSYPYVPDSSDIRAVVHALQFRDPECAKIRGGRGSSCGPYVCDGDGLVVFRSGGKFSWTDIGKAAIKAFALLYPILPTSFCLGVREI
ncbi:hypothetical protein Pmar_PMAR007707 [Perkinsus marinus ATCC 50983]|uniref:Uncharacterized protein n=1 Tax=Perkinsus marinus (strain ATCC 50983 / TXsc) TaxID=423536 RepID=C5K9Z3_PERM5|nr:hypothetical protein Pmar_PMAR007707 [Perkinsus marinus ATCC 50983]EER18699.1 hypothetical protein Pmar_PMAR007707 [Perkinsus marinus ATCC 50983]|eukprot:XP_002786903.1 hypothetical protein Pmar_PMAR007707 [Perkinsus marinus ATCC 50983]